MADVPCAFGDISDSSPMTHGSAYFFLLPNMRRDVVVAVMVAVEALLLAARERDEDPGMKAETMVGRVRADARRRSDFDCRANVIVFIRVSQICKFVSCEFVSL